MFPFLYIQSISLISISIYLFWRNYFKVPTILTRFLLNWKIIKKRKEKYSGLTQSNLTRWKGYRIPTNSVKQSNTQHNVSFFSLTQYNTEPSPSPCRSQCTIHPGDEDTLALSRVTLAAKTYDDTTGHLHTAKWRRWRREAMFVVWISKFVLLDAKEFVKRSNRVKRKCGDFIYGRVLFLRTHVLCFNNEV